MYRWVIEDNVKLIVPNSERLPDARPEMFDLAKDPTEEVNLFSETEPRVQRLREKLDAWWK